MGKKCRVGIIFGGRSVEHEVSIISAHQVMEVMDKNKYEIVPIYITREGVWVTGKKLLNLNNFKNFDLTGTKKAFIAPDTSIRSLVRHPGTWRWFQEKLLAKLDVIFPIIHGTHGEDGTLAGLLELANIPYVGAGVVGSAVGMDKIITKSVLRDNGLPTVNYVWFTRKEWEDSPKEIITKIETALKYPLFVKPSNLGSSVGINKAKDREDLKFALSVAGHYDRRLIVEEGLENSMEVNCAVLGNDDPIPSICEQPISWKGFLTYEDKYSHKDKTKGMKGANRRIPAPISAELTKEIQELAVKAFKVIDCRGVARVDFLIHANKKDLFINEINTVPGSLAFYLWEATGIRFPKLVDKLIELALSAHKEKEKITYSYNPNLLQQIGNVSPKMG